MPLSLWPASQSNPFFAAANALLHRGEDGEEIARWLVETFVHVANEANNGNTIAEEFERLRSEYFERNPATESINIEKPKTKNLGG